MSEVDAAVTTTIADDTSAPVQDGSFESFLQTRRASLQKKESFEVPVPGFDGRVIGVYHPLSLKESLTIGQRHENASTYDMALYISADTLITSCERIYGIGEDGSTAELGRWGVSLAKKFGIDDPNVDTARKALLAIFQGSEDLMVEHCAAVVEQAKAGTTKADEQLAGESVAATDS